MTGINVAPGSVVVVRDEEWLVTAVDQTRDGRLLHCQGLSELVRDTAASFYEGLEKDNIQVLDPARATVQSHGWDAVVIDESHNLTNTATQNNRLARALAANTDALILASATPHNGRAESFAELIRLLEPTAVGASRRAPRPSLAGPDPEPRRVIQVGVPGLLTNL